MGFRLHTILKGSVTASQVKSKPVEVKKGYVAVYVGQKQKRFVVPLSYTATYPFFTSTGFDFT